LKTKHSWGTWARYNSNLGLTAAPETLSQWLQCTGSNLILI
jgi:hypothetical protein